MRDTWPLLQAVAFPAIERAALKTLQLNLGYLCNISCTHCHVNAGPRRTELMDLDTMQLALRVAKRFGADTLDLTGGSPEMNPHFRWLVDAAVERGLQVMDRLNPTIIEEPGYEWVADYLAARRVEIVASLPCYSQANVDAQRGKGVFESSIRALASPAAGSNCSWSTTPAAPFCRRRRRSSKPTTSACSATTSASSSIISTPWPTCRSSASAACWCPRASSTATSTPCAARTATRTLQR